MFSIILKNIEYNAMKTFVYILVIPLLLSGCCQKDP